MRLPTAIKLGITSAWVLLLATTIMVRFLFDFMASYTYEPIDFDYPLYYAALATCFAGLLIIVWCLVVSRRLEKPPGAPDALSAPPNAPAALSDTWQALAVTHAMVCPLLAFYLIFATR